MSRKSRKKSAKKTTRSKKTTSRKTPEVQGWILLSLAFVMIVSLLSFAYGESTHNWLGLMGYTIGWVLTALFGLSSYIIAIYTGWIGWRRLFNKSINHLYFKHFTIGILVISASMLLSLAEDQFPRFGEFLGSFLYTQLWDRKLHFHLGGAPFYYLYDDFPFFNLHRIVNTVGVGVIFSCTFVASLLMLTKTSPGRVLEVLSSIPSNLKTLRFRKPKEILHEEQSEGDFLRYVKLRIPNFAFSKPTQNIEQANEPEMLAINPEKNLSIRPSLSRKESKEKKDSKYSQPFEGLQGKTKRQEMVDSQTFSPPTVEPKPKRRRAAALSAQRVVNGDFTDFKLPSTSLLSNPKKLDQTSLKKDLRRHAEVLEETMSSFGIEAKVGQINCGPTITSFEVHPAIGVKVQKIKTLQNDIALNMEARSIRILAPIPGKAAIGIEVPNPQPQEVAFKDMLNSYLQSNQKFHIPILLGKTVQGDYLMEDLAKMPHLIIAGATGSGKSVCINTIIMAILMTAKPDEVKMIMVDPKKVELTPFTKLPHMLAPVITEPPGACAAMSWLVKEMENRYEILKIVGFRNIASFNSRKINQEFEAGLGREIPEKMQYIVCIIDELADLMMVSSNEIETYIARIAQMARAVGIHLILATQRPSREVITGLIKANFPTRISFKVSSRINSQIILDEVGAESLLGNGDLLFLPPGAHHLVRAQGAYIRDEDISAVVESICNQAPPNYAIDSFDEPSSLSGLHSFGSDDSSKDSLFEHALETVLGAGNASTTFLQRKLKIGYARAASIIDQLEAEGIVGPADGSKPRKILVKTDSEE
ncbi:MAG: DNA translocase FtsK [Chlamydiae bacterium]|nr:DNA translocase FtsK [Chlamydiota bacterium]